MISTSIPYRYIFSYDYKSVVDVALKSRTDVYLVHYPLTHIVATLRLYHVLAKHPSCLPPGTSTLEKFDIGIHRSSTPANRLRS